MKKRSLFIVVAMVLLLAVVLGMGGTTFAKYITTKNAVTDTATVAKWGYVITASAADLFGEKYAVTTGAVASDGAAVVSAAATVDPDDADVNVVAPGTNGFMTFSINGTAEVMSSITVDVANTASTVKLLKAPNAEGTFEAISVYEPIKWTLAKETSADVYTPVDGANGVDLATLITKVEGLSKASVAANTPVDETYKISWVWAFEGQNDTYDTVLGDIAANLYANAENANAILGVSLQIDITVQQIEPKPAP